MTNNMRFVLARMHCPHCKNAKRVINIINRYLPYEKRIRIVENHEWEDFKSNVHPFINEMIEDERFDGYPFIWIDYKIVEPAMPLLLLNTLKVLLEEDLIMDFNINEIAI